MKDKRKNKKSNDMHRQVIYNTASGLELSKEQLTQMTIFQRKQVRTTLETITSQNGWQNSVACDECWVKFELFIFHETLDNSRVKLFP